MSTHLSKAMTIFSDLKASGNILVEKDIIATILNSLPRNYESEIAILQAQKNLTLQNVLSYLGQERYRRDLSRN